MRDSVNFGKGEHFGLIAACGEPKCKLHSDGYEAEAYKTLRAAGTELCDDGIITEGHISHGDPKKTCEDRCTLNKQCVYYSIYESGWCRLTSSCDSLFTVSGAAISI